MTVEYAASSPSLSSSTRPFGCSPAAPTYLGIFDTDRMGGDSASFPHAQHAHNDPPVDEKVPSGYFAVQQIPHRVYSPLAVDEEDGSSEGLNAVSDRHSLSSLASEVRNGIVENGRVYAGYGREHGLPRDEAEMDRIDMAHEKYNLLLNKRRFLAPISENPQQILDLGTGTGIWAMDMADMFPSAQVTGVDIAPIQPSLVPPNCHFEVDDVEQPWTYPENSFDFIFARDVILGIRDYPSLIKQAYAHCKPGGYVEFESLHGKLGCDDGSLPADGSFFEYDKHVRDAAVAFGTPLEDPENFKKWFEEAGFEMVVEHRFKMPTNTWGKGRRMKMVGLFERENFLQNLEGMSLRVFQRGLGWKPQETAILLAKVRNEIRNVKYHSYYGFFVVYGRKPIPSQAS